MHVQGSSVNQAQLSGSEQLKQAIDDNTRDNKTNICKAGLDETTFENKPPQSAQSTASQTPNPPPSNNITSSQRGAASKFFNTAGGYFTKGVGHLLKPPLYLLGVIAGGVIAMASHPDTKSSIPFLQKFKDHIDSKAVESFSGPRIDFAFNVGAELAGLLPSLANKMLNPTEPKTTAKTEGTKNVSTSNNKDLENSVDRIVDHFTTLGGNKSQPFIDAFGIDPNNKEDSNAIRKDLSEKLNKLSTDDLKNLNVLCDKLHGSITIPAFSGNKEGHIASIQNMLNRRTEEKSELYKQLEDFAITARKAEIVDKKRTEPFYLAFGIKRQNTPQDEAKLIENKLKDLPPDIRDAITKLTNDLLIAIKNLSPDDEDIHLTRAAIQQLLKEATQAASAQETVQPEGISVAQVPTTDSGDKAISPNILEKDKDMDEDVQVSKEVNTTSTQETVQIKEDVQNLTLNSCVDFIAENFIHQPILLSTIFGIEYKDINELREKLNEKLNDWSNDNLQELGRRCEEAYVSLTTRYNVGINEPQIKDLQRFVNEASNASAPSES